jgi:hypothetical protein
MIIHSARASSKRNRSAFDGSICRSEHRILRSAGCGGSLPKEVLAAIQLAPDEHEQMTAEQPLFARLTSNDRGEAVVAVAQIDRTDRSVNPDASTARAHRAPSARAIAAT